MCSRPRESALNSRLFQQAVILGIVASCIFTACFPSAPRADLVILNGAEPESLDPAVITGQLEGRIVSALFEGLAARDPAGRVIPGVAEQWDISPDGKTYLFHLRSDARWSDGRPVTAHDFVNSWKRTLQPMTAAEYAYQLYYIKGAEEFNSGKQTDFNQVGVHAIDPRTLEVRLVHPTPFFLDLCAFPTLAPVPISVVEQWGDDWIKPGHLVSNGAYMLEEWRINQRVRLRANPFYWDHSHVELQTIDALPTDKANTAFNIYTTGQADLILDKNLIPAMLLDALRNRPDFHSTPFLGTYFYRFNVTRPPMNHPLVRRAIGLAINKRRIVEKVTRAGEPIATHFVPPGTRQYESPPGEDFNPDKARQLLSEAGFPGGKGFPTITLLYADQSVAKGVATEVQDMLHKELGVTIQLAQQEWKVYLNSMSQLDYDIAASSWLGDYNDANTFLDMFVTGGGNNRTGWSSPRYDQLIRDAARELDPVQRAGIFQKAETLLIRDEAPIAPIYFYVGIQFFDPNRISGIEPNVLDEHPLKYLRKKN